MPRASHAPIAHPVESSQQRTLFDKPFPFVGASLLANVRLRQCLFNGMIRLQASSYKDKPFSTVGASLLANSGLM